MKLLLIEFLHHLRQEPKSYPRIIVLCVIANQI
jgi:hypothetical protein